MVLFPRQINALHVVLFAVLLSSCSSFHQLEKSNDWRIKYEAGIRYYEKQDYYHSSILFEQIMPIVRGLPEGEKVQFLLSYCQFHERNYILASHQFKVFYETYGRSSLVQEAQYMSAYSLYKSSLPYNQDQKSTIEAMVALQVFLNRHPTSPHAEKAASIIREGQLKLERKGFEVAKLYLNLKYYEAAVISLENFSHQFPDSRYIEQSLYFKIVAQYKWATKSIPSKQLSRYEQMLKYYKKFIDTYPNSPYLSNIQAYYSSALLEINKLNKQTTS